MGFRVLLGKIGRFIDPLNWLTDEGAQAASDAGGKLSVVIGDPVGLDSGLPVTIRDKNIDRVVYGQSIWGEAMKIVDRGDPAGVDLGIGSFPSDFVWRDIDLSAIVPAGALFVQLVGYVVSPVASQGLHFRKKGNSNSVNILAFTTQVNMLPVTANGIVACNSARVIQGRSTIQAGGDLAVTVSGWVMPLL